MLAISSIFCLHLFRASLLIHRGKGINHHENISTSSCIVKITRTKSYSNYSNKSKSTFMNLITQRQYDVTHAGCGCRLNTVIMSFIIRSNYRMQRHMLSSKFGPNTTSEILAMTSTIVHYGYVQNRYVNIAPIPNLNFLEEKN